MGGIMTNRELLMQGAAQLGLDMSEKTADRFETYARLLVEWNKKINLTAITEGKDIVTKHFLDSLTLPACCGLDMENASMIDVGTGAGFPGLAVKLQCPSVRLTLLDSLAKRLKFLEAVAADVGAQDVAFCHARAEDGGQDRKLREQFDIATARAVANLSVLAEYCLPFVKVGGVFAALKGPMAEEELQSAAGAIETLGGKLRTVQDVTIPFAQLSHKIVLIDKVRPTPKQYPRKAGTPAKKPLA